MLDYPCDLKKGDKVTFILSLHGAGSIGNWQRHYFPILDYKDKYKLVIATPTAATAEPTRTWQSGPDDGHLQNIVTAITDEIGKENIKAFWLVGHSQGGATSSRLVCTDFFKTRVDGFLSLSGGRIGTPSPGRSSNGNLAQPGRARPVLLAQRLVQAAVAAAPNRGRRRRSAAAPPTRAAAGLAGVTWHHHIYETGEHGHDAARA
jgi:pimeloyl-ACP methyl ester carboxylesterase